ncbi:hypothetical protein EX895_000286 [Sporisorium graminicola]|uniref:FAD-binding domain-containing protein n=1 Tax=Sporisorium graminicola TaxID=280036 RepID=A0A4U7L334_9BASI|nr:hypothetical protein EX895_000286 [Sporisorium graminicola]TKY90288.1 hypothetical protein EX895_000286 [Sporisorium graminicola]
MTSQQQKKLRIAIVGAGIAGFAAARALREDHDVHIFESSSFKQELGAAIHTGPNASRILLKWGMDLERLESPNCRNIYEYHISGKLISHRPLNTIDIFGAPWLLNHRISLHKELQYLATSDDPTLPGEPAKLYLSSKVVQVDGQAGVITLADGTTFQSDIIVGGDGIKSLLQQYVLGRSANAKPSGHSAYRLMIPFDRLRELNDEKIEKSIAAPSLTMFVGQDRRVICYTCKYDGRDLLNVIAVVPDEGLFESSTESWSAKGSLTDLAASFSEFPDTARKILGQATECALYQLRDQDPLDTWHRKRVLLIGDAAHPMLPHLGQGGSQAIEDAEALAYVLKTSKGLDQLENIESALERLQTLRYYRATVSQERSRSQALGPRPGTQEEMLGKNTFEFTRFLYDYSGAEDWEQRVKEGRTSQQDDVPHRVAPQADTSLDAADITAKPTSVSA